MFQSARLKLTLWYVLMIMGLSALFSLAFYRSSTWEIEQLITRVKVQQEFATGPRQLVVLRHPGMPTLEELQALKHQSLMSLLFLNGVVLVVSGAASYFLAGRTLRPIQAMVNDQKQFIENASHELRTPLATMRAEMEGSLLEKRFTSQQARKLIESNLEELTSLQTLTNNLLQLTKVHASGQSVQTQDLKVSVLVAEARKKVQALANKKQIKLETTIAKSTVSGDKSSLTQLLVILLENALKYSDEGTTIRVLARKAGRNIKIQVADEGMGIASADLPHIFERFYRADKSRSQDGYGLGLSIAQRIVQFHSGTIDVKSKVGTGTTFTVVLPRL